MDLEDEVIQLEDMVTSWEDTVLKMKKWGKEIKQHNVNLKDRKRYCYN